MCFASTQAQTTTFTYQGRLTDTSMAANGTYDFQFAVFDASTAGTQQGATQTASGVTVTQGIFTVQLDFTSAPFQTGADRYLEIQVKKPTDASYTTLTPRQRITSAPYAIRSLSAGTADTATNATQLNGQPAASYVVTTDARLSDARAPTSGSSNYIQNGTAQQTAANFNVSGNGTAGGTLSGNAVNATTQYNLGGNRVLSAGGTNNLFAGINAGNLTSTGNGNSFVGAAAGQSNTTGSLNSFVGTSAGNSNTTGNSNSFFGRSAGQSNTTGSDNTAIGNFADVGSGNLDHATAIGADATVATSNTIALGRANGSDNVRIFGLGTAGAAHLCINANNEISTCSSSLRYKTNIAPFSFGLSFIKQLRPISFDWKADGMKDVGFGAEDVARVNPLFVNYNAKGEVEGVKYDRLSVVFVNAFKEQQTQIETLQQQNKQQSAMIEALKKLVCANNQSAAVCREQ